MYDPPDVTTSDDEWADSESYTETDTTDTTMLSEDSPFEDSPSSPIDKEYMFIKSDVLSTDDTSIENQ